MHDLTQKMADIEYDVEEKYGIRIQVLPIPVEDRT